MPVVSSCETVVAKDTPFFLDEAFLWPKMMMMTANGIQVNRSAMSESATA